MSNNDFGSWKLQKVRLFLQSIETGDTIMDRTGSALSGIVTGDWPLQGGVSLLRIGYGLGKYNSWYGVRIDVQSIWKSLIPWDHSNIGVTIEVWYKNNITNKVISQHFGLRHGFLSNI